MGNEDRTYEEMSAATAAETSEFEISTHCEYCALGLKYTHDITCVGCCVRWIEMEREPFKSEVKRHIRDQLKRMDRQDLYEPIAQALRAPEEECALT